MIKGLLDANLFFQETAFSYCCYDPSLPIVGRVSGAHMHFLCQPIVTLQSDRPDTIGQN